MKTSIITFTSLQDKATSTLGVMSENKMYTLLQNMAQKELKKWNSGSNRAKLSCLGLTFTLVGHRNRLFLYHYVKLMLN